MVSLTLQSTLLSLNKTGKICKAQSSANNPISEEEENHAEKESDSDAILFSDNTFLFSQSIELLPLNWPRTASRCFTHVADITVPPPEFSC
jgi:hypothetical protein